MKFFKTAWKNIRRSPYQALAAILIMTLTFLVVSFFTFILFGSSEIVNFFIISKNKIYESKQMHRE
jgi:cell division transport system permease protein